MKNKQIIIAAISLIMVSSSVYVAKNYSIIHNKSKSLPYSIFLIAKNKIPKRGQIFAFKAKKNLAYKEDEIFIKIAGGTPGDKISVKQRTFYINDKLIGIAKTHSLKGEALTMSPVGVIPKNNFFAYTPHKDSYDSRYQEIGLINEKNIIGTVISTF